MPVPQYTISNRVYWLCFWFLVAITIMFVVAANDWASVRANTAMENMVDKGTDPISARCAVFGAVTTEEKVACAVRAALANER